MAGVSAKAKEAVEARIAALREDARQSGRHAF
jgi:hypothetical protein